MRKNPLTLLLLAGIFTVFTGMVLYAQDAREPVVRGLFATLPDEAPVPDDNLMTAEKVELGKMLYFEPRLSASGVISCHTCHNLSLGGTDRLPTSLGHNFQTGGRNAPTRLKRGVL